MEIVIVGLGTIAQKHIIALKSVNDSCTIKALRSSPNASIVSGIDNIYSIEEVGNPDFVIIANPTHLHAETIKTFARLKVPMFIEKPPVHDLVSTFELEELIAENDIFSYIACNLRFHPCIQFLKDYLTTSTATINEVNIYCGSYLPDWRPGRDYKEIYSANVNMGGGVHLDLFHEMDYTFHLFGSPTRFNGFTSHKSTLNIDAPDYANYLLSYPTFNVSIILNYYRRESKRTIEILFEEETVLVDLINNTVSNGKKEIIFKAEEFKILDTYVFQMEYFISCLKEKKETMNTLQESLEVLKISLANESIK